MISYLNINVMARVEDMGTVTVKKKSKNKKILVDKVTDIDIS